MSDTLLVLAASPHQLATIRTAQRLGYRVVTVDNVPTNPGHAVADASYAIDTTDAPAVLATARRERIRGIVAAGTDVAVPTAASVAAALGLPGPPPAAATTACDKLAFRDFQRRHGLPHPEAFPVRADALLADVCWRDGFVLKPDRASGGKGIFIVSSAAELRARLPRCLAFSPTGTAVLERRIEGAQGTCEGVLEDGRLALAWLLDRDTRQPPYVTTRGHRLPTTLPPALQERVRFRVTEAFRLLGIVDGPFDCDFVATRDEVFVLELSPRLGGNWIAALLQQATGVDLVEYAVRHACGERIRLPSAPDVRPTAIVVFGVESEGRLAYDAAALAALRREPWMHSLALAPAGERVQPFVNSRHAVGHALLGADTRPALDGRVQLVEERLALRAA